MTLNILVSCRFFCFFGKIAKRVFGEYDMTYDTVLNFPRLFNATVIILEEASIRIFCSLFSLSFSPFFYRTSNCFPTVFSFLNVF